MALANRLAIIAGGIGGIGSATGRLLRSQGSRVAVLYAPHEQHNVAPTLEHVYGSRQPDHVSAYPCDISSPASVDSAFTSIRADLSTPPSPAAAAAAAATQAPAPSILVNAAGYVGLAPLESISPDEIMRHYRINVLGPMLTAQAFARLYFDTASSSSSSSSSFPGGRIVNISSQAAHVALHHHGAYCASKAALLGLTKCMASEWGPRGITANSVSPGPVWTVMGEKAWADREQKELYQAQVPTGKFAAPEEVAATISFLCQDAAQNINGADLRIDGGYTAR